MTLKTKAKEWYEKNRIFLKLMFLVVGAICAFLYGANTASAAECLMWDRYTSGVGENCEYAYSDPGGIDASLSFGVIEPLQGADPVPVELTVLFSGFDEATTADCQAEIYGYDEDGSNYQVLCYNSEQLGVSFDGSTTVVFDDFTDLNCIKDADGIYSIFAFCETGSPEYERSGVMLDGSDFYGAGVELCGGSWVYHWPMFSLLVEDPACPNDAECGNGLLEDEEECDDENILGGDGCDSLCAIEEGWTCEGEPSICEEDVGECETLDSACIGYLVSINVTALGEVLTDNLPLAFGIIAGILFIVILLRVIRNTLKRIK